LSEEVDVLCHGRHWRVVKFIQALHAKIEIFRRRITVDGLKDMWAGVPRILTKIGRIEVRE
jgi:hypothetical protein